MDNQEILNKFFKEKMPEVDIKDKLFKKNIFIYSQFMNLYLVICKKK